MQIEEFTLIVASWVIPESTRKEVTQIQRTGILVIESKIKNSQVKLCVFEVENCFALGVRRY